MHGIPYPCSTSSALAKLTKGTTSAAPLKQQGEKKETPQERLKRIMSKQLNKQSMPYYKGVVVSSLFVEWTVILILIEL